MRKKMASVIALGLLLTGCGTTTSAPGDSPTPTPESAWDGMSYCEIFESGREAFQETIDNPNGVTQSAISEHKEWAEALEESAPAEEAEDTRSFILPTRAKPGETLNAVDVFMAGNRIATYCITH